MHILCASFTYSTTILKYLEYICRQSSINLDYFPSFSVFRHTFLNTAVIWRMLHSLMFLCAVAVVVLNSPCCILSVEVISVYATVYNKYGLSKFFFARIFQPSDLRKHRRKVKSLVYLLLCPFIRLLFSQLVNGYQKHMREFAG